jgi:drug/metabolite transporter (DMT)-like permease
MSPTYALLIAVTLVLDVMGQFALKLGVYHVDDSAAGIRFWQALFSQPWLLLGVAAFAVEFILWLAVLSVVDLSIAYPLVSLSYCGVLIVSRVVLGEKISPRRWTGCGLITMGAALVCVAAT